MNYKDFKIVNVDIDYMRTLYNADHEVMFSAGNSYRNKPFWVY